MSEVRVLDAIEHCRTAALGGHVDRCDQCGHQEISYNSCRNRHCPKCLEGARRKWLEARESELLPVPYFHVVFTIPHELAVIAQQNRKAIYKILFNTAWETLRQVAADPKHLGAEIGVLAVLHTWGQSLEHHPHVHCVVTGGGIAPDGQRWVACRNGFFLPVRVLARLFRGKFLHRLKRAFDRSLLNFKGSLAGLTERAAFAAYLRPLYETPWVVYPKPPFGGPEYVLRYLARYTHRVAISNGRLISLHEGKVSFRWKDYAHGCRHRLMTLSAVEFLRRFLLHVLPQGFKRIRQFGLLANRHREQKLAQARKLLKAAACSTIPEEHVDDKKESTETPQHKCPVCGQGTMIRLDQIFPMAELESRAVAIVDTS